MNKTQPDSALWESGSSEEKDRSRETQQEDTENHVPQLPTEESVVESDHAIIEEQDIQVSVPPVTLTTVVNSVLDSCVVDKQDTQISSAPCRDVVESSSDDSSTSSELSSDDSSSLDESSEELNQTETRIHEESSKSHAHHAPDSTRKSVQRKLPTKQNRVSTTSSLSCTQKYYHASLKTYPRNKVPTDLSTRQYELLWSESLSLNIEVNICPFVRLSPYKLS